jgi:DNA-binding response OmpR family regulator
VTTAVPAVPTARPQPRALLVDASGGDLEWVLTTALRDDGYEVTRVESEREALDELAAGDIGPIGVVIVDLGDRATRVGPFCEAVRTQGYDGPVVVIQGSPHELHAVDALDSGADAYLVAPHSVLELRARLRAITRRLREDPGTGSGLLLDPADRTVSRHGRVALLSLREFELLRQLHAKVGTVVREADLRARVWGVVDSESKVVGVTVGRLRTKLEEAGLGVGIVSVRGRGYRLDEVVDGHV